VTLVADRVQTLGKTLAVSIGCKNEACVVSAAGVLKVKGARPVAIAKVSRSLLQGTLPALKLKLSNKARTAAARALRKGKKVTAEITVTARDAAGKQTVLKTIVRLRLRKA
jgi:hypothetical protein